VHKSEKKKKKVCGQPTADSRARARDGSMSRRGALAEQGEAGSGRRPLPVRIAGAIAPVSCEARVWAGELRAERQAAGLEPLREGR
jgi:hypothetical protein